MRHTTTSGLRARTASSLTTRPLVLAAAAVLAAGLAQAPAGAHRAKAPAPACGDTVTTDVVLTRDLTCAGDALVVAAPGVTVDLGGRRITGSGSGAAIRLVPPATGVTVRHGRISGFGVGVQASVGTVRLDRTTLTDNDTGAEMGLGPARVSGSTFRDNRFGIVHVTAPVQVTGSTFRDNQVGISCNDAGLSVEASTLTDNEHGVTSNVCGIRLLGSTFTGGETAASVRSTGYRVEVRDNVFRGARVGLEVLFSVGGSRTIVDNVFLRNGAGGLVVDTDDLAPADRFEVARNLLRGNGFDPGDRVDPTGAPLTAGLWARAGTLAGNQAQGNAGHGIAAYGAVDGGGNRARRNGAEPQCVGVVCTR